MNFDLSLLGDCFLRLGVAAFAGGVLGLNRELTHHWAGLRTHIVVALGAATFVMLGEHVAGGDANAVSRVVQGVAAGIGFLGAGTILKLDTRLEIKGLTTAGTIWLAAAMGTAAGLSRYELLIACTVTGVVLLTLLRPVSTRLGDGGRPSKEAPPDGDSP